jgi:hypothetical protein
LRSPSANYLSDNSTQDCFIGFVQLAELPVNQSLLNRGNYWLDRRWLEQSCLTPLTDLDLAQTTAPRIWLVIAISMRSGRTALYAAELITTAGRFLVAD